MGFKPNPSLALGAAVAVVVAAAIALIFDMQASSRQAHDALTTGGVGAQYLTARMAVSDEAALEREGRRPERAAASRRVDAALRRLPHPQALLRRHAADDLTALRRELGARADAQSRAAVVLGAHAYSSQRQIIRSGALVVLVGTVIFGLFGLTVRGGRRRLDAARAAELARLEEMAITDALTGLRNHRAFHEDLARELQRSGRQDLPLALALFDIDDFKALNSDEGHQAGDERLRAFTRALEATIRATDCAYRTGGDEFAVILPDCRAWGALELAQRLQRELDGFSATAGVAEAVGLRWHEDLLREADQALLGARRLHQQAAIYTPELDRAGAAPAAPDEDHKRMLATALARAVDAKDAYTRSHCQTVSQLTAVIGAELGLDERRLARLRLAGLLHDVGKIGVPDAILNKPAKLTDDEYAVMQRHSLLGHEIVAAAGLAEEARWVRHHHERVDGRGYPDRLAGDEIPLESRIILVADAFEAMTSDRPYRTAPGREFALEQLRGGAGSQFDADVVEALCGVLDRTAEPEPVAI